MKTKVFFIIVLVYISSLISPSKTAAQGTSVSFQVFYDNLSPYGQWVEHPQYGYIWIPDYERDFAPYRTYGHWVMTNYGWTWASDYVWGWATFHYGRWGNDPTLGWYWIPGTVWGPAWVEWRQTDYYYGWAPLGPDANVDDATGSVYSIPADNWVFVENGYMGIEMIFNYYLSISSNLSILQYSTVITNTYIDRETRIVYIAGPSENQVERVTNRRIYRCPITERNEPGHSYDNDKIVIYKPRIDNGQNNNHLIHPNHTIKINQVTPIGTRKDLHNHGTKKPEPNLGNYNNPQPIDRNNVTQKNNITPKHTNSIHPENHPQPKDDGTVEPRQTNTGNQETINKEQPNNRVQPKHQNVIQPGNHTQPRPDNPQSRQNNSGQSEQPNTQRQREPTNQQQNQPNQNNTVQPRQQNTVHPRQQQYQPRQQNTVQPRQNNTVQPRQQKQQYQPRQQQQQYQPRQQQQQNQPRQQNTIQPRQNNTIQPRQQQQQYQPRLNYNLQHY